MIETAARSAQFLLAIGIAYIVALWFALIAWTFRDIESRSRSVFTQVFSTLLVVLFFVPGLLLYLILRPKETLDQAFQRALEEEYILQDLDELPLCPGCQRSVDPDFVLCPHCQTKLRAPCPSCSKLIDLRWGVCPFCAVPVESDHQAIPDYDREATRVLEDPRSGRRRRAVAAAAQRVGIEPEELDAFTDALAGNPSPAAVTAEASGSSVTRRLTAFGDTSRLREGLRGKLGPFGSTDDGTTPPPVQPSPEDTVPDDRVPNAGFWADPLPGHERTPER